MLICWFLLICWLLLNVRYQMFCLCKRVLCDMGYVRGAGVWLKRRSIELWIESWMRCHRKQQVLSCDLEGEGGRHNNKCHIWWCWLKGWILTILIFKRDLFANNNQMIIQVEVYFKVSFANVWGWCYVNITQTASWPDSVESSVQWAGRVLGHCTSVITPQSYTTLRNSCRYLWPTLGR